MAENSLGRHDPRARVRFVFRQQLQAFLDAEMAPLDPHELFKDRVRDLELAYTACPHYLQPDFLENHARKHTAELIARRDEIMQAFRAFHEDTDFVEYVKQHFPHLYLMAKWEVLCLAVAETWDAQTRADGTPINAPPKKKPTPEEVRAYKVRRQQVHTDDLIAQAQARLEAVLKARQFLDQYDLDEDERQLYERELTADIMAVEEEQKPPNHMPPGSGYRQL